MPERMRTGLHVALIAGVAVAALAAFRLWLPGDLAAALGAIVLFLAPVAILATIHADEEPQAVVAELRPIVEKYWPILTAVQGLWIGFVAQHLLPSGLIYLAIYGWISQRAKQGRAVDWIVIFRGVLRVLTFGVGGAAIKFLLFAGGT